MIKTQHFVDIRKKGKHLPVAVSFRVTIYTFIITALLCCTVDLARATDSFFKDLPLKDAVRIGNGDKVVIEFSDPDCRFSRRMVKYWDMRLDVTRYIFLITLKNHPDAEKKARFILCASDREAAYRRVYAGEFDFGEEEMEHPCNDHGLAAEHGKTASTLGVSGSPTYFIGRSRIDGAKVGQIEQLLGGEKIPFDPSDRF